MRKYINLIESQLEERGDFGKKKPFEIPNDPVIKAAMARDEKERRDTRERRVVDRARAEGDRRDGEDRRVAEGDENPSFGQSALLKQIVERSEASVKMGPKPGTLYVTFTDPTGADKTTLLVQIKEHIKGEIEEDAKVATVGEPDGKERIIDALSQLGLAHETSGPKGIHTNYGEPNKFDSVDKALASMASTKLRHYETLNVSFRKMQESAHDVLKDIARAANLDMQVGFQTQAQDGSTWQHVDLFDGDKLIAVAGVRNASRHKDHPDFGSYILIDVKADALTEEPLSYEQHGHNDIRAVGSLPDTSKEDIEQSVRDAAKRVREKREARKAAAEKGE